MFVNQLASGLAAYAAIRLVVDCPADAKLPLALHQSALAKRTVIGLGHNLGRTLVAEGVETEGQLRFLEQHDCDEVQCFYFCHPLPADEVPAYLHR